MSLAIDHVVILVKDLAAAITDYTALGFTVTPGGEHTGGATHNALIAFADNSYIELIAFKREAPEHRWWKHSIERGEGLIDFALVPDNIDTEVAAMRERGLEVIGPEDGGRLRPDGQAVQWRNASFPTPDMPFLCADVTPRSLRVASGDATKHANTVLGIAQISVAVVDLPASTARYQALLGVEPNQTRFQCGASQINLEGEDSLIGQKFIKNNQEGACFLVLRIPANTASEEWLEPSTTHGVLINII